MTAPFATGLDALADAVSVIIPTHRRPEYVRAAIQSAAQQSLPPFEIIVIDDGATLPADFSAGPIPPGIDLQVRRIPHVGQCGARRAGFDISRGGLLLFLDDDDVLVPDAVATLRALYHRDPGLVAAAGAADSVDGDGVPVGRVNRPLHDIRPDDLWVRNRIANAGCALISREAYQLVGGWDADTPNAGDYMLWMKLARAGRIAGTEQIVLHYRSHVGNETTQGNLFANLRAFRATFRRVFPDLARSEIEDSVLASLITPYVHPAIRHWRDLVRRGEWGAVRRRSAGLLDGIIVASSGPRSRRELAAALALWRPKWLRLRRSQA
ncbi:MAG TPA: glycosyltransferase [Gemmatimonadales bacterium]|jgi:glycosyltransferase involved in cell wall biosynthesis